MFKLRALAVLILGLLLARPGVSRAAPGLQFMPVDESTGQPVGCRMHLKDSAGKVVLPPGLPAWRDHFDVVGRT
jgi:hypothetical protein